MEIGKPQRRFWVEPLEDPVPRVGDDEPDWEPTPPREREEVEA